MLKINFIFFYYFFFVPVIPSVNIFKEYEKENYGLISMFLLYA